jgi:hypothetical protein
MERFTHIRVLGDDTSYMFDKERLTYVKALQSDGLGLCNKCFFYYECSKDFSDRGLNKQLDCAKKDEDRGWTYWVETMDITCLGCSKVRVDTRSEEDKLIADILLG